MQRTAISCPTNISLIEACISLSTSMPRTLVGPHAREDLLFVACTVKRFRSFHVIFFSPHLYSTVSEYTNVHTLNNVVLINAGITRAQ